MSAFAEVRSPFQNKPAYRYLRATDKLPHPDTITEPDPLALVKLFNPTGAGSWYISGYDPETEIATGAARVHEFERGDIYLPELVEFRGRFGLPIERDLHWEPRPLSQCEGT